MKEIRTYLSGSLDEVTSLMAASLRTSISLLEKTNGALLDAGGKRVRPILCLLSAGVCGEVNRDSINFAAAFELLHNATLLHDDVVDGASTRRGNPTVNSVLGSPASVLVGDYWLVKAVDCILSAVNHSDKVLRTFSKTLSDLTEGEMLQMEKAITRDTTQEDYIRIIYCKTASLFESAARGGAISAGVDDAVEDVLGEFGRNLGIAFQIKDDILDYLPSDKLGKPAGQDLLEHKITQPLLCVLSEMGPEEASALRARLAYVGVDPSAQEEIRECVVSRGGIDKAVRVMESYIDKAIFCLDALPESKEKSYLARLARYMGERNF